MKAITLSTTGGAVDSGNDPAVSVTVTPAIAAGQTLRFSLIVVDANGIASQPAFVDVPVVALPVAVLTGPAAIAAGSVITLDASASTPKGKIATFKWQLVNPGGPVVTGPIIGGPIIGSPVIAGPNVLGGGT